MACPITTHPPTSCSASRPRPPTKKTAAAPWGPTRSGGPTRSPATNACSSWPTPATTACSAGGAGPPPIDPPTSCSASRPRPPTKKTAAAELPHRPQGPHRLRFPYGLAIAAGALAVADTANNRILLWPLTDGMPGGPEATGVLGQPTFDAAGENRWTAVADDTLCWPYGVSACGDALAVADSGNNRVTVWRRTDAESMSPPTATAASTDVHGSGTATTRMAT